MKGGLVTEFLLMAIGQLCLHKNFLLVRYQALYQSCNIFEVKCFSLGVPFNLKWFHFSERQSVCLACWFKTQQ